MQTTQTMTSTRTMPKMTNTQRMPRTLSLARTAALPTVLAAALLAGCAGTKRSPQAYRADTQQVLATRDDQIKRCYDKVLAADAAATGTVTVHFVVEKKTGAFTKATVDPSHSNAREPLVMCVLEAMNGLKLQPPDANEGQASFTYELTPTPAPTVPTTATM